MLLSECTLCLRKFPLPLSYLQQVPSFPVLLPQAPLHIPPVRADNQKIILFHSHFPLFSFIFNRSLYLINLPVNRFHSICH